MYNLARLTLSEMAQATTRIRKLGADARSFEDAADRIVRFIYDEFGDAATGERGPVLVRLYKTHPFGSLPPRLQALARQLHPEVDATTRCLVLVSTLGTQAEWSSRTRSKGHQVIPLPSPEAVERLPMGAALLGQLGIDVGQLLHESPTMVDSHEKTFNVFYVAEAAGSTVIPAQRDFVAPHGVRSVLGCGGLFPDGQLYAAILFSKQPISPETADTFRTLTLAMKLALLKFNDRPLFEAEQAAAT